MRTDRCSYGKTESAGTGGEFKRRFADKDITKILTIGASGVGAVIEKGFQEGGNKAIGELL